MKPVPKEFVMEVTFDGVWTMPMDKKQYSEKQEFFGVNWQLAIKRTNYHLGVYTKCSNPQEETDKKWSVDAQFKMTLLSTTRKNHSMKFTYTFGNRKNSEKGWKWFIDWLYIGKYLTNELLSLKLQVKINKMVGFLREPVVKFAKVKDNFSDVTLKVSGNKFYVSRLTLALNSTVFETLLFEDQKISKKKKFTLDDVDPEHFQFYLEVIYGRDSIDDNTVEGILHLANRFRSKTVLKKCEGFLVQESNKKLTQRKELLEKYNMETCKEEYIEGIRSGDDVKVVAPCDVGKMDRLELEMLLQKALTFV